MKQFCITLRWLYIFPIWPFHLNACSLPCVLLRVFLALLVIFCFFCSVSLVVFPLLKGTFWCLYSISLCLQILSIHICGSKVKSSYPLYVIYWRVFFTAPGVSNKQFLWFSNRALEGLFVASRAIWPWNYFTTMFFFPCCLTSTLDLYKREYDQKHWERESPLLKQYISAEFLDACVKNSYQLVMRIAHHDPEK